MSLVRKIASTPRLTLIVAMASSAISACSSSTEPAPSVTPDGIRVTLATDSSSLAVDHVTLATLTLENTTNATVSRSFEASSIGPYPESNSSAVSVNGFGSAIWSVNDGHPHVLSLGAHETFTHAFELDAVHAGSSIVKICFPKSDAGAQPSVCASRSVVVTAGSN